MRKDESQNYYSLRVELNPQEKAALDRIVGYFRQESPRFDISKSVRQLILEANENLQSDNGKGKLALDTTADG